MKAPERIWADPPSLFEGVDLWHEKQEGAELTAVEYIRKDASDAAIAAALEREAKLMAAIYRARECLIRVLGAETQDAYHLDRGLDVLDAALGDQP